MDREAKDQYLLVIQAKDMVGQNGGLSGTTSVTVTLTDVNDNPPRFPRSKYLIMSSITSAVAFLANLQKCLQKGFFSKFFSNNYFTTFSYSFV